MKTLDEVVTVMDHVEFCCTNCKLQFDCDEVECFLEDALHYLKEYQILQTAYIKAMADLEDNPPLTWDELKQMAGKPVWVEMEGYKPNWGIVMNQDKRNGRLMLYGYDEVAIRIEINEEGEGTVWQAYRKERA